MKKLLVGVLVGLATLAPLSTAAPAQASNANVALNQLAVQMYMQNLASQQQAQAAELAREQADAAYRYQLGLQNAATLQQMQWNQNHGWGGRHFDHRDHGRHRGWDR